MGIDKEKVIGFYNEIKSNITILYPSNESLKTFELLIDNYQPKGNRVYDVEIVSILATNKVSKIATVNIDDFKNISEIELIDLDNYK